MLLEKTAQAEINIANCKKGIRLLDSAEKKYAKDSLAIAYINLYRHNYYLSLEQLDKALHCSNIAYAFFKEHRQYAKDEYITVLTDLSYLYAVLGDNQKAINYIKEAEYVVAKLPAGQQIDSNLFLLANKVYYNYAYILSLDKEYQKSRYFLFKILQLPIPVQQNRNAIFKSTSYKIADLYEKTGQVDSALFYIAKSKNYSLANEKMDDGVKQMMNDNLEMAYLRLQSKISRRQHQLDSAIFFAEKSFARLKHEGWLIENNDIATQLALDYAQQGNLEKANQYYQHAKRYFFIETATNYENKEKVITDLLDFAVRAKKDKDIAPLATAYQQFLKENYNKQKAIAIKNAEIRYQVKAQDDKIEKLALANKLKSNLIKQRTLVLSAVFLFVIAGIFFYYYQLRLKEKYVAIDLEERLRLAQMSPHFISNSLSAIQRQIYDGETKLAVAYLNKYAVLNRLILENSRNKFIDLSDELDILQKYIELQQLRVADKFDYQFNLSDEVKAMAEEIKIPNMLLQPLIENAIEHAFKPIAYKGLLILKMTLEQRCLSCEIIDNGIGLQHKAQQAAKKSFSIQIIKERLALLNRQQQVKSSFEMIPHSDGQPGLTVKLIIPFITAYD
ncbi:histidine kinase [Pedobacter sp. KR3-3]|uniref:Histidine kinase n=1 Tax=Pedobacter albus TaxID=3113905 RepID=A0ABU7I715_9SPHI|nr:histidine kinase [Pedobacter sp. KR3-3]MEE1945248.1 histidine kinase [Pedobacter sp. KR3-3]